MAKSKPIRIHDKAFKTQEEARQYIRELRDKYEDGESLNQGDAAFVYALLLRHPLAEKKIGCGIAYFTVWTPSPPAHRNRGFYIVRLFGPGTDFSFEKCLRPVAPQERFRRACRTAISRDIVDFRNRCFDAQETCICPLTGLEITRDFYHVDHHEPQFYELVRRFIAENGIDISAVDIGGDEDNETQYYFRDETLSARFRAFHEIHGRLRLTAPPGNLQRKRGPRFRA